MKKIGYSDIIKSVFVNFTSNIFEKNKRMERDELKNNPNFIEENQADLAASLQKTIIDILIDKLDKAVKEHPEIKQIAIGGGVSANSGVRDAVAEFCEKRGIKAFIPKRAFTTDNAAMVAIAGYFKYLDKDFCPLDIAPFARVEV